MAMRLDCKDYTESSFPFEMNGDFSDEAAAKAAFLRERVEPIWKERAPKMWNFQVVLVLIEAIPCTLMPMGGIDYPSLKVKMERNMNCGEYLICTSGPIPLTLRSVFHLLGGEASQRLLLPARAGSGRHFYTFSDII